MWYFCDICDTTISTGDMWLQTELLENCWNILPRPHHRRPHPGSHNMAKRHQGTPGVPGTPACIFFWALVSSTPCCTARPSWSTPTRFCWPTTIIIKSMKSQSSGGWKKNSVRFVEFVVLPIWNYVPDFNPSCFSWTRRTSTFGTRRFNSSENSETSTRASTNRISSKCRSRETENDLRQNKSMIRL